MELLQLLVVGIEFESFLRFLPTKLPIAFRSQLPCVMDQGVDAPLALQRFTSPVLNRKKLDMT